MSSSIKFTTPFTEASCVEVLNNRKISNAETLCKEAFVDYGNLNNYQKVAYSADFFSGKGGDVNEQYFKNLYKGMSASTEEFVKAMVENYDEALKAVTEKPNDPGSGYRVGLSHLLIGTIFLGTVLLF